MQVTLLKLNVLVNIHFSINITSASKEGRGENINELSSMTTNYFSIR
jgi:hypothetical protein